MRFDLARERKRIGYSQRDLAKAVQINYVYLGLIEAGRLDPTPEQIQRIERFLNIAPAVEDKAGVP